MIDILYIEDNEDEINIFKRVVGRLDTTPTYQILQSGNEAIDYLLQSGEYTGKVTPMPRLTLIDLNLPGSSGFDVIQQVRAKPRTRYMSLVVYSTSDNPQDMRRAFDLGANAYLIKPGSYLEVSKLMDQTVNFWLKSINSPNLLLY